MRTMYRIITIVVLVCGCSRENSTFQQTKRGAPPPINCGTSTIAETSSVVTGIPTMIIVGWETTVVCALTQKDVDATKGGSVRVAAMSISNECDKSVVFDLSKMTLDSIALEKQGIRLYELNTVRLLQFRKTSTALSTEVDNLPTGAMQRTVFVVGRFDQLTEDAGLVRYGAYGAKGAAAHLGLAKDLSISFVAYFDGVRYMTALPYQYYALSAVYSGTSLILYVDGKAVASNTMVLATLKTPVLIGLNFVGMVAEAKIWNRVLSPEEVSSETARAMDVLKDAL